MFPTELWGSKRNMVCLARAIERFVVLRRHENMSVLEVSGVLCWTSGDEAA